MDLQKRTEDVNLLRPSGVPAEAMWNDEENEWELGEAVDGNKVGTWRWWATPTGYLVCESEFSEEGELLSYTRFHPDGTLARQGTHKDGVEHGTTVCVRCKVDTSEFFPPRAAESVWKTESDFVEGEIHEERYFLEDGTPVSAEGVPLRPERPRQVPRQARWNQESGEWELGEWNDKGQMDGKWWYWHHRGHMCAAAVHKDDWLLQRYRFHPDGSTSLAEKYQESGGVAVYKMFRRSPNPSDEHFPEGGVPDEVFKIEYMFDPHGYIASYRFYDQNDELIEKTQVLRDASGSVEQSWFADFRKASEVWTEKGAEFKEALNAWLGVIYKEGGEPDDPEPEDERDDMERIIIHALEKFNADGKQRLLRKMFPPAHEPFSHAFWERYGRSVEQVLVLDIDTIVVRVDDEVYWVRGSRIDKQADLLAVGASRDKKYVAKAYRNRIEVLRGWDGPVVASFPLPLDYGVMFHKQYPQLKTDDLTDPANLGIRGIQVLPDGRSVVLVSVEGIWLLTRRGKQLLYPDPEKLQEHADNFIEQAGDAIDQYVFNLDIRYPNADVSPDGELVSVGGKFRPPILADFMIYEKGDDWRWKVKNTSGDQAIFPKFVTFHDRKPHIAVAACLYASLHNDLVNTTFRLDREQLDQSERIEEFAGGLFQNYGIVSAVRPLGDGFLLGMSNGYLWHMGTEDNLQQLGYLHLGGTITSVDITADQEDLFVGTDTGQVVHVALGGRRDPNLITDMQAEDRRRWVFWKTFKPMVW